MNQPLSWEEQTVMEMQLNSLRTPATLVIAAMVRLLETIQDFKITTSDASDYIGCFKRITMNTSVDSYQTSAMRPCKCVAYCNHLGYSLGGMYAR